MGKNIKKRAVSTAAKVVLSAALVAPLTLSGGWSQPVQAATTVSQGDQIAAFAESLDGKPYRSGGISPEGFSGPGFVYYVYKHYGIDLPRDLNQLARTGQALKTSEVQPGDLVFLTEKGSDKLEHVGIYLGDYKFVVSAPGTGGVDIHTFEKEALKERYAGARRVIGNTVDMGRLPDVTGVSKQQQQLLNALDGVIGKPYGNNQNGPVYFDGEGLVEYAYEKIGVSMPSSLESQSQKGKLVSRTSLVVGDVVFFGTSRDNLLSAAIYVGDGKIAIASQDIGHVVVRDMNGIYDRYYLGAKRILEVAEPVKDSREELADAIIETGLKYWGTPYKFGAEYPTSGMFDCSSFTQWIFYKNGIKLPRTSRQQATVGTYVPKSQLEKGDLVFFSTSYSDGKIAHVGVYVGDNKFLHTYGKNGVHYSSLDSKWWKSHYKTARRVIE
ncbi:MAG: C40 family peptidase [Bacillaceae bacterium]|nr:C40 family peptidase [Bacillaceae bacterium]